MRTVFLFLLVAFPALDFGSACEEARKKRDLLVRTKRRWVLSTIELEEEMIVNYPYFISKMYNDKIQGKDFRFEITGEAVTEGYLTINENTGEVFVLKSIDREKYPCFHVIFNVYDTDTNQKIDKELAFDVEVKDINDNPPRFTKFPKTFTVNESQAEGSLGVEVIAQDIDEKNTKNSTFNITVVQQTPLEPNIQAKWIDERTVHLNFTGCFDYEKAKEYKITLEAKDHGTPPLSSTAVITLNVRDTNTHMPEFKKKEFQTEVHEMKLYRDVFRFPVEDKDTPNTDGWHAKFFFISGNEEGIFKVETDPKTNEGIFNIVKEKNYEITTMVELEIGVENIEPFTKCVNGKLIKQDGKLYRPDSISVTITIIDDNDPPVFQPPKADVYEKEESEPGRVLFTPKVYDPDSSSFRFELVDDPANWVSIDEKTGEIRAIKKMDRESPFVDADNVYKVVIAAIDDGKPPAKSFCNVSIHLRDINDHKPQLVNNSLILCGNKNNKVMIPVQDLDAEPYSGPFSFYFDDEEDKKHWELDPAYGQQGGLVSLKPLPYGNYSIPLRMQDQQNNEGHETLEVVVCDCAEKNTCRSKLALSTKLGGPGFGLIIVGILLFLILLLTFLCNSGREPLKELKDEGNQTLIKYNQEGGVSACNAEPVLSSPKTVPDGIKQTSITRRFEMAPEFYHNEEMYRSELNMMRSMNFQHQKESYRTQEGRSMYSSLASNRMSSYRNKSMDRYSSVRSDLRSDYNLTGQVERKMAVIAEADARDKAVDRPFIYNFEGQGSKCGSLDKLSLSNLGDNLQFLDDLGPKFKTLADICQ
uniref:Cadherin 26, tandem duplicate 1 n=1 Tax=Oryzias latipes TaxID=8090 RepID=A0A3B3H5L2_ORYLA